MKNTMKKIILTSTFIALMFISANNVLANSYGSDVNVIDTPIHTTVDAGIEDLIPQLAIASIAISGLLTTSILLLKTK